MERFDIYLRSLAGSSEPAEAALQRVFGLDRQRARDLLRSLPRVVKRDVPGEYAVRYQQALDALGADFELRRSRIRPQQVIAVVGGTDDEAEPLREEFEAAFTLPPPRPVSSAALRINATVLGAPPVVVTLSSSAAPIPISEPAPAVVLGDPAAVVPFGDPAAVGLDTRPNAAPAHYSDTVVDPPRVFPPTRTAPLAPPMAPVASRALDATRLESRPPPVPEARPAVSIRPPAAAPQWSSGLNEAPPRSAGAGPLHEAPPRSAGALHDTLAETRPAVRVSAHPRSPSATLPESVPVPALAPTTGGTAAALRGGASLPAPMMNHAPVHPPASAPLPREASMVQLPRSSLAPPPAPATAGLRPPSMAIPLNSAPPPNAWAAIPIAELTPSAANNGAPYNAPAAWDAGGGADLKGRPGWFMDNTGVFPNSTPSVRPPGNHQAGGATPQLRALNDTAPALRGGASLPPTVARGPAAGTASRIEERGSAPGATHAQGHGYPPNAQHAHGTFQGRRPPSPTGAAAPAVGMNPQQPARPGGPVPAAVGLIAGRELSTSEPSVALRWLVRVVLGLSLFVIATTVRHIRALDSSVDDVLAGWGERRPPPEPVLVANKGDENAHPELGPPALEWMESDYHQFSSGDKDRVRGLVDRLVAAGASELHVGTITTVGTTEIAGELIVQLPADEQPRKAVLAVYDQYLQATFGGAAPPHGAPEGDLLHITF